MKGEAAGVEVWIMPITDKCMGCKPNEGTENKERHEGDR